MEIREDGTLNYSLETPPSKSSFFFYDENLGFASSGDVAYKTINGGMTWEPTSFPKINIWSVIHFADENNGIVVNTLYKQESSGGETWSYAAGLEIFATQDGGENWQSYVSGEGCALEGRLSHSAKNGEVHFHAGNYNGTYQFDFSNSVNEEFDKMKIRPNPVNNYIYLDNDQALNYQAKIFTLAGELILDENVIKVIDTGKLSSGYYILKLSDQAQNLIYPFIKS